MTSIAMDIPAGEHACHHAAGETSHTSTWRRHAFIVPSLALALGVCAWFVTFGDGDLFAPDTFCGFYDAQARSILAGRLDVPKEAIDFEAFSRDGKTYGYFGIGPALLRLPLVKMFPSMDDRWSRSMILIGCAINLICAYRIFCTLDGDGRERPRVQKAMVSLFILSAGIGSTNVFLASRSYVYHEAIMWGSAFALLFVDRLLVYQRTPTIGQLVCVGVFAFMALQSRVTIGAGTVLGLAGLAIILTRRGWILRAKSRALIDQAREACSLSSNSSEPRKSVAGQPGRFSGDPGSAGVSPAFLRSESRDGRAPGAGRRAHGPHADSCSLSPVLGGEGWGEGPGLENLSDSAQRDVRPLTLILQRHFHVAQASRLCLPRKDTAGTAVLRGNGAVVLTLSPDYGGAGTRPGPAPECGRDARAPRPARPFAHAIIAWLFVALSLGVCLGVNYAKFRTFDGMPVRLYGRFAETPVRMTATDGKQLHLANLPTGFASYFGIDVLEIGPEFPWVYMEHAPRMVGSPSIDLVERYSSIVVCMPALFLLVMIGWHPIAVGRTEALRRMRLPALAVMLGGGIFLMGVGITQRYIHDLYPFLVVTAAPGLWRLMRGPTPGRDAVALAGLTFISVILNCAFAYDFQREVVWGVPNAKRQELLQIRLTMDRVFHREAEVTGLKE